MPNVLGLDLSLRSSGLALAPIGWKPALDPESWKPVRVARVGSPLKLVATPTDKAKRITLMSKAIADFATEHDVVKVWFEEYAFSQSGAHAHELGELGGAVKMRLFMRGIAFDTVVVNTARAKLGKFAKQTRGEDGKKTGLTVKKQVEAAQLELGAPLDWKPDERDAFVVLNHGLVVDGYGGVLVPRPKPEKKPRAPKKPKPGPGFLTVTDSRLFEEERP
jgi:hypothetical protein